MPSKPGAEATEPDREPSGRASLGSVVRTGVVWGLVVVLVAVGLLQTPPFATAVMRPVMDRLLPAGTRLADGGIGWLALVRPSLHDVRIETTDGEPVLSADRVSLNLSFGQLLRGRMVLDAVRLDGARLTFQDRDGSWGLFPAPGTSTGEPATEAGGATDPAGDVLRIRSLVVREGRVEVIQAGAPASPLRSWSDTTVVLEDLAGRVTDLRLQAGGQVEGEILRLVTAMRLGVADSSYALRWEGTGRLTGAAVVFDTLNANGRDARLEGALSADWSPVLNATARDAVLLEGTLAASDLSPEDVRAFAPAWKGEGSLSARAAVRGPVDSLTVDLEAQGPRGGTARGPVVTGTRDGVLWVSWDLDFSQVAPRTLVAEGPGGWLSGSTRARVEGARPDVWTGALGLTLRDSQIQPAATDGQEEPAPPVDIQNLVVDLTLDQGRTTGDARGRLLTAAGRLDIRADIDGRVLDSVPSYDLNGLLDRRAVEADEPVTRVAWTLNGSGLDPELLDVDGRVTTVPGADLRVGALRLDTVSVSGRLAGGSGAWSGFLGNGGGTARGQGDLRLDQDRITIGIDPVRWTDLDLARLVGDTVPSASSGVARGSVVVASGKLPVADLDAQVGFTRHGPVRLDSATVAVRMERSLLDARFAAWAGAGRAAGQIDGLLDPESVRLALRDGSVRGIDLRMLVEDTAVSVPESDLNAELAGTWEGTGPASATASVRWSVYDSRIGTADSVNGTGTLTLERQVARVEGALHSREGGGRLEARLDLADSTWTVDELLLDSVVVAAWTGSEPATGGGVIVRARASGVGSGITPSSFAGEGTLDLSGTQVGVHVLDRMRLDLDRAATGSQPLHIALDGTVDSIRIEGSGEMTGTGADLIYQADLRAWAGQPRPAGAAPLRVEFEGRGTDVASLDATLRATVDSFGWAGARVDAARIDARASEGRLQVDSLRLEGQGLQLQGGGALAFAEGRTNDFQVQGTIQQMALVRAAVDARPLSIGEGEFSLEVTGPYRQAALTTQGGADALLWGEMQLVGLDWSVAAEVADLRPDSVEASVTFGALTTPTASVRQTEFDVGYDGERIRLALEADVDDRRTLRVQGRLDPEETPGSGRVVEVERLDASLDEDQWTLVQPARIRLGERIEIDSLHLEAGDQFLLADGFIQPRAEQDLFIQANDFQIGTIADLLGVPRLTGAVSGTVDLSGTALAPRALAELSAELSSPGAPSARITGAFGYEGTVGDVDLEIRVGEDALEATASPGRSTAAREDRGVLTARGTVPLRARVPWAADTSRAVVEAAEGTVELDIQADSLGFGWLRPFADPAGFEEIHGFAHADVRIRGSADQPQVEGRASIAGGSVDLVALGTTWEDMVAQIQLTGSEVRVDSVRVRSGDGALTGSGTVELVDLTVGRFQVDLRAREFEAIDNDLAQSTLTGTGRLEGTTARPVVVGDLRLLSTDVFLGGLEGGRSVEDVTLTESDYQELEQAFGRDFRGEDRATLAVFDSLSLDVAVSMGRDTWVRQFANPTLAIQMSGDLRVQKQPGDSIQLVGQITAVPERSFIEQFGRRFQLTEGVVDFRGSPALTEVDLRGAYSVPSTRDPDQAEVTIELGVQGDVEGVDILLSSDPPMDNSDIVSYLATGRPASRDVGVPSSGGPSRGLAGLGTDIALGAVASAIEGAAAQSVGLDVIDIETRGLEGATLVAGRYVSPRLFVGFKQPLASASSSDGAGVGEAGSEVELEYQALRWLLLNLEAGGRGFDFLFRTRYAY